MVKFEYITKTEFKSTGNPFWMNEIGKEGWELVGLIETKDSKTNVELIRYYFKREI